MDEAQGNIGGRVEALRERRGLTRAGLAAKLAVGEGAIRKIENGITRQPKFSNGVRLAAALAVWPDELAFEDAFRSDLRVTVDGTPVEIRLRVDGPIDPARHHVIAEIIGNALATAKMPTTPQPKDPQAILAEILALNERIAERLKALAP